MSKNNKIKWSKICWYDAYCVFLYPRKIENCKKCKYSYKGNKN